ncbi:hypothetical protein PILCRDRAFT_640540 [Piloderma croceum F 1598]|uniref:Uncharacterized protein n=1 Tax=Piloderma croceum (strain F 1598) TaxID=765440 RepID=A0A0C3BH96_PILCF|nr:hypothetical protein PILCRDRAFT_640540 [Piloderma croceum F 1598]
MLFTHHFQISPFSLSPPLPFLWDLLHFTLFISLQQGQTSSQGLVGSAVDMNWDSSVPQAVSIERRGEGTCVALVGFLSGA